MITEFFKEKLIKQYGIDLAKKIMEGYSGKRPVTLRINTIKANTEEIKKYLTEKNIEYQEVEWNKEALILPSASEENIQKLSIYEEGKIYLQSLSSMIPAMLLKPNKNENILDMAAAPGGKTTQMYAMTDGEAMITACEMNKIRVERLRYNLQKQGATRVNVLNQDARRLDDYFSFDKILLDAPCSGSGTENVLKQNFTEELIKKSIKTQEALLKKAIKILKKNGEMVYSTCSILKDENEEIVKKILKNGNAEIVEVETSQDVPILPVSISRNNVCNAK